MLCQTQSGVGTIQTRPAWWQSGWLEENKYFQYHRFNKRMEQDHIYRAKLDFLYQSIAVYAATIVIYLLVRGLFATGMFPTFWQDPLLLMLCAITLISVLALLYNLLLRRQIEITTEEIRFMSRARKRAIGKNDVRYMQFGRERGPIARKGVRIVKIALKKRRRPVRIRLGNFEHSRQLLHDLKEWAGPFATTRRQIRAKRISGGSTSLGEHTA